MPAHRIAWQDRVISRLVQTGAGPGCWCVPWVSGRPALTVRVGRKKRPMKLARLVYTLFYGEPQGWVLHRCDAGTCIRPTHLYDGTDEDNIRDRVARGRTRGTFQTGYDPRRGNARGEGAPMTEADVRALRARYAAGNVTQAALAAEYGLDQSTVWAIINRQTWRHVP